MKKINELKLYPITTDVVRFPLDTEKPYSIIVYPENIDFLNMYQNLKISRRFVRAINPIFSRFPRVRMTGNIMSNYRTIGLKPVNEPNKKNSFVDLSLFLDALDKKFDIENYQNIKVIKSIYGQFQKIKEEHEDRDRVLLYTIDLHTKFSDSLFKRRVWPLIEILRRFDEFPFEYFLCCVVNKGKTEYFLISNKEDTLDYNRVASIFKGIKSLAIDEYKRTETYQASNKIVSDLSIGVDPISKEITGDVQSPQTETNQRRNLIHDVVKEYLNDVASDSLLNDINKRELTKSRKYKLINLSIIYKLTGDKSLAEQKVKEYDDQEELFKQVKENLLSDVVSRNPPQNDSRNPLVSAIDVNDVNDGKEPSHVLNKRVNDFRNNLRKDVYNSFKLLEKKEPPLKVKGMKVTSMEPSNDDLEPSHLDRYTITLEDENNKEQEVNIDLPHLRDDGTFLLSGRKKYLVYQMILDPIFFLKKYHAKLETLYATVSYHLKVTKKLSYLWIHIGGYRIPMLIFLSYFLGFDETCKLFNIKYNISSSKPEKDDDKNFVQLSDGNFIVYSSDKESSYYLMESLRQYKGEIDSDNYKDHETYRNALIRVTGNRSSIYIIDQVIENIMEPVAVQVLRTKMLPYKLDTASFYICEEMVKGRVDKRNHLGRQRIRSSEVFVSQIIGQILKSYNDYRFKKLSGDEDANYDLNTEQQVKEVVNSSLVREIENINPVEELSCLTRTTPTGPGGIPDSNAISIEMRGSHDSYFGNIDSMDTPEGNNVGVLNQLTVDAAVTSGRGSFVDKSDIEDDKSGVLSVNSAMIPYVGSTDGCRVMFSGSQGRQSIPCENNEAPLVQTGYESIFPHLLSDSYVKKASGKGTIQEINEEDEEIKIKLDNGKIETIDMSPKLLNSGQGKSSMNRFSPSVKEGQRVSENQIIAEGKHMEDGMIAMGSNILCAIMNWKGYSYEDGYIISETAAVENFTSTSYSEIKIHIDPDDDIKYIVEKGTNTETGDILLSRSSKSVESIIGGLEENQQGKFQTKSPGGKVFDIEVYCNSPIKKFPILEEAYEDFKRRYEKKVGEMPKKFKSKIGDGEKEQFKGCIVIFKIENKESAVLGDKITNNYGGKGVIAQIEKDENMPITPWGERVDLILNPLAIVNRMNPATVRELHTSLIAKLLAKKLVKNGVEKRSRSLELVSSVMSELDNTKDQQISKKIVNSIKGLSDKNYQAFLDDIEKKNYFFPIVVPPFKEPKNDNIKDALKKVGGKAAYELDLPEFEDKTKREVSIGYLYYKKLEQQSSTKMNSRSTGLMDQTTGQAVAGKSKEGGQKVGEHDSWAFISHNADKTLREFFGPLSDDPVTKNQIVSDIVQTGGASYRKPEKSQTRSVLKAYLKGMMLDED